MSRRRSIYIDGFKHSNPLPNACRIGNLVMSSVIVGRDPGARTVPPSLETQCANMFAYVRSTVEAAGGTTGDIIKMTFWMKDRSQRDILNGAWAAMFPDPDNRPARHSVQTELDGGVLIQCDFTAVLG
ncbi:MAG: RidA family protein [Pseudolabrys sp.]